MSRRRWGLALVWAGAWLLIMTAAVYAQDAARAAPAEEPSDRVTVLQLVWAGGPIGWLIIGGSLVAAGLVIEHFMSLKPEHLLPAQTIAQIDALLSRRQYAEAIKFCQQDPSSVARITAAGLGEMRHGYAAMAAAMQEAGQEENIRLNQKIGYLSLIGTMAPMAGLLGTVTGMIRSFNRIAQAPVTNAAALAGGIREALVTTCLGLIVAIPTLFFYSFFQNRVTRLTLQMGAVCDELIRRFKPIRVKMKADAGTPQNVADE